MTEPMLNNDNSTKHISFIQKNNNTNDINDNSNINNIKDINTQPLMSTDKPIIKNEDKVPLLKQSCNPKTVALGVLIGCIILIIGVVILSFIMAFIKVHNG